MWVGENTGQINLAVWLPDGNWCYVESGEWIGSSDRYDGDDNEWKYIGKYWYYFRNARMYKDKIVYVGGRPGVYGDIYAFDVNGHMITEDWYCVNGFWYFSQKMEKLYHQVFTQQAIKKYRFRDDGVLVENLSEKISGWMKSCDRQYYIEWNGRKKETKIGWLKVKDKWYYMNKEGIMQIGWTKVGGKWYYLKSSGEMQTGWAKVGGKWYYLNRDGMMVSSNTLIDGKLHLYNKDGVWLEQNKSKGWKAYS